jgi:hypothetical protein
MKNVSELVCMCILNLSEYPNVALYTMLCCMTIKFDPFNEFYESSYLSVYEILRKTLVTNSSGLLYLCYKCITV